MATRTGFQRRRLRLTPSKGHRGWPRATYDMPAVLDRAAREHLQRCEQAAVLLLASRGGRMAAAEVAEILDLPSRGMRQLVRDMPSIEVRVGNELRNGHLALELRLRKAGAA